MLAWTKLQTLMRAGVRESVEKVTDANAIRIYQQEIAEADALLIQRREALAAMIASRRDLQRDIDATRGRIEQREEQLGRLAPQERSDALLQLAAREIAVMETHLASCQDRHVQLCGRITGQEVSLRRLLQEITEHRRGLKVLQSQLAGNRGHLQAASCQTVAGRLATLRQTRSALCDGVTACDDLEAGMEEARERISGDPVERLLAEHGQDQESQRVAAIVERLRGMNGQAAASPGSAGADPA